MRVSAWDVVQPECRLHAADRHFLDRRHDAHLSALKSVKPSIDNRTPPKAMAANMVKVALKHEEIDRINQLLQAKLKNMNRKSPEHGVSVSTVASASVARPRARDVARENSLMRRRLENVRSGLRAIDQKKDFARHEKYLKQISKVKVAPSLGSPTSPPSLVPLAREISHTASSGWSDELWGERRN
jgi:hypothetical protein